MNPERDRATIPVTVGSILVMPHHELDFSFKDLSDLVNRVQRDYCLRHRRLPDGGLTENKVCRFYYPRPTHEEAIVT
jgi:hypothetical protein